MAETKSCRLEIRISPSLLEYIQLTAESLHMSKAEFIRMLIEQYQGKEED